MNRPSAGAGVGVLAVAPPLPAGAPLPAGP